MRIGINLLYLLPGMVGGTQIYANGLLNGLAKIDKENEYFLFVNQESQDWLLPAASNFNRIVCPIKAVSRGRRYYFEQFRLPGLLKRFRIQLVHSLGYVGPIFTSCPSIVTIHDMNFMSLRDTLPAHRRAALSFFVTLSAKRAKRVITVSQFSKNEICRYISIDKKISVIYEGSFEDLSCSSDWVDVQSKYDLKNPYLVAFGWSAKHKNTDQLVKAFAALRERIPDYYLVLIGKNSQSADLMALITSLGIEDRVINTGYVPRNDIFPILNHSQLFVFPSLYEGFGLPLLEAQQAGVVIASSNRGSLPEIGGEGCLYFDPTKIEDMARAIWCSLEDVSLRARLVSLGRENLKRFSWIKTAQETLDVYQRVAG
jgi:glycosyltransferase involved in cell wall biosynthesis